MNIDDEDSGLEEVREEMAAVHINHQSEKQRLREAYL